MQYLILPWLIVFVGTIAALYLRQNKTTLTALLIVLVPLFVITLYLSVILIGDSLYDVGYLTFLK